MFSFGERGAWIILILNDIEILHVLKGDMQFGATNNTTVLG